MHVCVFSKNTLRQFEGEKTDRYILVHNVYIPVLRVSELEYTRVWTNVRTYV